MMRVFGGRGGAVSFEQRGGASRGRRFGSLFFAAFAALTSAMATEAGAGCQTTTTITNIAPSTMASSSSSAQTLTIDASVVTLNQKLTTSNQSTCNRAAGTLVFTGKVEFSVRIGVTTIGTAVTDTLVGLNQQTARSFTAQYTIPAGTAAGAYTVIARYTGIGADDGQNENGNSVFSSQAGALTITPPKSDMSASLNNVPTPMTVGVALPSGSNVVCTNASPGTVAATTATCSASGLPAGLALGACTPTSPQSSLALNGTITCPVTGTPTTVGSFTVIGATSATNDGFSANNSATKTITVNKGTQTALTLTPTPATINYTTSVQLITGGGSGGGTVTYTTTPGATGSCSLSNPSNTGVTVTGAAAGTCSVTATKAGGANYNDISATANVTINKIAQSALNVVANPSTIVFGQTSALTVTGGSGTGEVTLAVVPGANYCTVSGSSATGWTATGTGIGVCYVKATKAGDGNYYEETFSVAITVDKAAQTIEFTSNAPEGAIVGGETYTPVATGGDSGEPVVLTIASGSTSVCSISGAGVVSFTGTGSCVINANQAGNTNYAAAAQVSQTFTVGKGTQTITVSAASPIQLNGASVTVSSTNESGSGNVSYSVAPGTGTCALVGTALTGTGLGTCTVTATKAGNANYNEATSSVTVTVVDTTKPIIASCPADITQQATSSSGAVVSWTAPIATDNSGAATLMSSHNPGATFAMGPATTVTYTATDPSDNAATCSFTVTVQDTIAPVVSAANITVAATGPSGASVTLSHATASDAVTDPLTVTYSPPSGTFAIGVTQVTASAIDAAGNTGSTTFTVTVTDQAAPEITVPSNITAEATGPAGAIVNFTVSALDAVDGDIPATATPASGSTFAIGTTTVNVTASDLAGNPAAPKLFTVTVQDTTPPQLTVPANITVNAGASGTASVPFAATAEDLVDPSPTFTYSIAPGSSFALGTQTVTVTAKDASGNASEEQSFTVTVLDNTAPQITCPANITIATATSATGSTATWSVPEVTDNSGTATVTSNHEPGALFPIGTTTVTYTATDASENSAQCSFNVSVGKANQTITFTNPGAKTFTPGATFELVASSDSELEVTLTSTTTSVCTVSGSTATIVTAGDCTIEATQTGDVNYNAATMVSHTVAIGKAAQTTPLVAAADPETIDFGGTSVLSTTGGNGTGAVTYAVTTGEEFCSISDATLTGTGVGVCTVTATKAADENYNPTTATVDVTVNPIAGNLKITTTGPFEAGSKPVQLTWESSSEGTVTFGGGTEGVCSVSTEGLLTILGLGDCAVTALQGAAGEFGEGSAKKSIKVIPAQTPEQDPEIAGTVVNVTEGTAYPGTTFTVENGGEGCTSYRFGPAEGSTLPPGLTLSESGVLSGRPTRSGTFTFTITAFGLPCEQEVSKTYTISVRSAAPPPAPTITLAPGTLPDGDQGVVYATQTITATGGTAAYKFAVTGGALPAGLTLAPSGALTGTPGAHGTFTFTVTATDANGFKGTKVFTVVVRTDFIERRTSEVNRSFMKNRADVLSSQGPDRLRNRGGRRESGGGQMSGGNNVPFNVGISGGENGDSTTKLSFATSLSQMLQASRSKQSGNSDPNRMALGGNSQALPSGRDYGLDLWVEGNLTHFRGDEARSKGDLTLLYVGADYLITPGLLVGALVQFDHMSERSAVFGSEVKGQGWMAGPYMSAELTPNLFLDARAAWGTSDNATSPFGTYVDHFDTTRWLARADLTGNWEFGQWRLTPSAGISYFEDEQDAYVDSNGIVIAGQTVSLGRVTFGPEVGYRFKASDGSEVEPFVGFQGIWDFDSDGTTVNGIETGGEGVRGKVQAGLGIISPWGYSIRGTASYDGIGSDDFEAISGQVWVNMPLQ